MPRASETNLACNYTHLNVKWPLAWLPRCREHRHKDQDQGLPDILCYMTYFTETRLFYLVGKLFIQHVGNGIIVILIEIMGLNFNCVFQLGQDKHDQLSLSQPLYARRPANLPNDNVALTFLFSAEESTATITTILFF